ncbi:MULTISPECIES: hypothetical protein [Pseudoalteromonas]|uniref:DUF304 domain-containing protein n=1 Tax=Pseudoalteromonas amylolytica TaxID=1859457 RepID=A0A1S1MXE5_9GAMM|nr:MULTISPECIES: hypothetical protein [Pseudoalteromonas]OHU90196.1 hypothetical protein BFC16_04400 [Pseudoalteromonas sp. JW3]OHU92437.1 hypothetical protein BET10_05820 [Pseudoalteromonas amylolytica]
MESYYNVQYGLSFLFIIVLITSIALFVIKSNSITAYFLFATSIAIAVNFYSLSISVSNSEVKWKMGLGLISGTIEIDQIEQVNSVRNPWYVGWGIRTISNGTLYNVSGFDAVHIKLKGGKNIRLGTNKPDELESAIRDKLSQ